MTPDYAIKYCQRTALTNEASIESFFFLETYLDSMKKNNHGSKKLRPGRCTVGKRLLYQDLKA